MQGVKSHKMLMCTLIDLTFPSVCLDHVSCISHTHTHTYTQIRGGQPRPPPPISQTTPTLVYERDIWRDPSTYLLAVAPLRHYDEIRWRGNAIQAMGGNGPACSCSRSCFFPLIFSCCLVFACWMFSSLAARQHSKHCIQTCIHAYMSATVHIYLGKSICIYTYVLIECEHVRSVA